MIFWLTENYQLFIKQTLQLCGDLLLIFVWCKSTFNMFWVSDKTRKSKTSPQAILWLASYASTPVIAVTGWIMLSGRLSVCTSIYCCKHDISQTAQGNFFSFTNLPQTFTRMQKWTDESLVVKGQHGLTKQIANCDKFSKNLIGWSDDILSPKVSFHVFLAIIQRHNWGREAEAVVSFDQVLNS